ncbi:MAG: hypothetical protein AB1414_16545 [bacterium]
MNIYRLIYVHLIEKYKNEEYFLGYYSSIEKVQINILLYQTLPGFRENPHNFVIQNVSVEGYIIDKVVYEVQFYLHDDSFSIEYDCYIGVYNSEKHATIALDDFKDFNQKHMLQCKCRKEYFINKIILDEPVLSRGFTIDY